MNNDLISRQAVIKEIESLDFTMSKCLTKEECYGMNRAKEAVIRLVKALQHYTQRAKWVNNEGCIPECSNCHYSTPYDYSIDDYEYGNYCPNCGAKMEGDGE